MGGQLLGRAATAAAGSSVIGMPIALVAEIRCGGLLLLISSLDTQEAP